MKILKTIFFIGLMFTILISCSKEDEIRYSCNKTINTWVKNNLSEIHQMSRGEWLHVSPSTSSAIYRAFTPQQRIQFWKDKLDEVMAMKWSKGELSHIKKVDNFISSHQDFFSEEKLTDDQLNELETFFYKWQKEGESLFGWNAKVAISIAGAGNRLKNTQGELISLSYTGNAPVVMKSAENCNCNTGMISDFCHDAPGPCENVNCEDSFRGCGWLFLQQCNGTCGGI